MPAISVILPVYNGAAFLAQAVESILAQTYGDFELLALDDGSTDGSREILEGFAATDPRVRVISRENRGLVATLNEGIGRAHGEYIARMDADDISLPGRFAAQIEFLSANPDILVVGGQVMLIDPTGRALRYLATPTRHEDIDHRHMTQLPCAIPHPAVMMRTESVRRVGGYDERCEAAEDKDLWLRLAEIGKLANLDCPVLHYRLHPESIGHAKMARQRLTAWEAIRAAAARRGVPFDLPPPEPDQTDAKDARYRRWGWWALQGQNTETARSYAWKALYSAPLEKENWRLLACAIRGY